jgi:hypothetical protein
MKMIRSLNTRSLRFLFSAGKVMLTALGLSVINAHAASQFIIEAGSTATTTGQHRDWWAVTAGVFNNSSGNVTPQGVTSGNGSRFMGNASAACTLSPVLDTPGGAYLVEFAIPSSAYVLGTVIDITTTGCTGLPSTTTNFSGGAVNVWRTLGTITVDSGITTPTITFAWDPANPPPPGASFFNNRMYTCTFRFTAVGLPCQNTPVPGTITGPLAAGQTTVTVPGVANNATAVAVYMDNGGTGAFTKIGEKTSGVVAGNNTVTVTGAGLTKGSHVVATQTVGGQESCVPGTGPLVGGGANPAIRVNFMIHQDPSLTGPAGAVGTYSATAALHALGSVSAVGNGFLNAPKDGAVLNPDGCWQTVSLAVGTDPEYPIFSGGGATAGTFGTFAGIALCLQDTTDVGPFNIYIDNISNGTNNIEDFETPAEGTANYFFNAPRTSGTTSAYMLSAPNTSVISTNNADTGSKSARISWQFSSESTVAWVMLFATNRLPQVDLSMPITARILVLPVGQTNGNLQVAALGNKTVTPNGSVTFTANILKGTGPFTYQWKSNTVDISGETGSSLTLNNAQTDFAGAYSVTVGNGACSTESFGTLTIQTAPNAESITYTKDDATHITLHWTQSGWTLQEATTLGSWSNVNPQPAGNSYTVTVSAGTKYFRLIHL